MLLCHIRDWDLELPWLVVGYRFSQHALLASISLYFSQVNQDPELPTFNQCDVMTMMNFNNISVWIQACEHQNTLFK
jgi:hypothetical protein